MADTVNEETNNDETATKGGRCKINRRLLPLKIFYFFYHGAVGSVLPFLTVYLKSLGLTALETGVIGGTTVFVGFIARLVLSRVADHFKAQKIVLLVCCLLFGFAFSSMWFFPPRQPALTGSQWNCNGTNPNETCWMIQSMSQTDLNCHATAQAIQAADDKTSASMALKGEHSYSSMHKERANETISPADAQLKTEDPEMEVENERFYAEITFDSGGRLNLLATEDSTQSTDTKHRTWIPVFDSDITLVCAYTSTDAVDSVAVTLDHDMERMNHSLLNSSDQDVLRKGVYIYVQPSPASPSPSCRNYTVGPTAPQDQEEASHRSAYHDKADEPKPVTGAAVCHHCHYECKLGADEGPSTSITGDFVFFLSVGLLSVARAFYATSHSLSETVTYSMLSSEHRLYSRQRLWGSFGTASAVLVFTTIDDQLGGHNFSALFLTSLTLMVLACLSGLFLRPKFESGHNKPTSIRSVIQKAHVKILLFKLLILGMYCGAAVSFIFWFLKDLGSSQMTLGICVVVGNASSIVIGHLAEPIFKRFGEPVVLYVAMAAYAVRFALISLVEDPWMAVPVELLHGVTYTLLGAATSATIQRLAPVKVKATCQAVADAIYIDIGRGLGFVITGQLFKMLGARWTFRAYGGAAVVMIALWSVLDYIWPFKNAEQTEENVEGNTSGVLVTGHQLRSLPTKLYSNSRNSFAAECTQGKTL
nr:hypothetical protein BaRGS_019719 [Batillaria attramentaria]